MSSASSAPRLLSLAGTTGNNTRGRRQGDPPQAARYQPSLPPYKHSPVNQGTTSSFLRLELFSFCIVLFSLTKIITMEQPPVQIGQFILGKNLGIGAFGKVRKTLLDTGGQAGATAAETLDFCTREAPSTSVNCSF